MISSVSATKFIEPDASQLERAAFLVGLPIAHSSSPALHHALYTSLGKNWGQLLCETSDLASFIEYIKREPKCMGSGVTMPFKVEVCQYLDELTPEGEAIGAVNTIFFKQGPDGTRRYCGTNTDCIGIRDAFLKNMSNTAYRGTPGLVVGGGGTCRAAVYSLQNFLGCSPIYIINRDKAEVDAVLDECRKRGTADQLIHVSTLSQAESLTPPGAIVSAVPDFTPQTPNEKTVRDILSSFLSRAGSGALLEMCYHPSPDTQITALARNAGWQVIGGIEAMVFQGLAQASLWTGLEIDEALRNTARKTIQERMRRQQQEHQVVHEVKAPPVVV